MNLKTFKKGVHPYGGKELSADSAVRTIAPGKELVFPLLQNIGILASPCVAKGDRVLKGQLIADGEGLMCVPVHSSVSGTVKAVEKRLTVNGDKVMSVVVENDGLDETVENFGRDRDASSLSGADIVKIIADAGIVGFGGAGFPTAVKLSPRNPQNIDTFIINCAECEPYLTNDYRLMVERAEELVKGAEAVLKIFDNAKVVFAVENNKLDAIKELESKTAGNDRITVQGLKTKYPQGGERQLVFAVTRRKLNSKMLPADKGCLVINTATCFAVYEAVYKNIPCVRKVMTVTGEGANSPCNLDVPLGMSHREILEAAGGAKDDAVKFISGGPMMGIAMESLDVPAEKTSSSILIFTQDDVAALKQSACIHCGKCVSACPERLVPQMMCKSVKGEDFDKFDSLGGMECVECGCCTYVCPAKIPLTQMFKFAKSRVRESQRKVKEG